MFVRKSLLIEPLVMHSSNNTGCCHLEGWRDFVGFLREIEFARVSCRARPVCVAEACVCVCARVRVRLRVCAADAGTHVEQRAPP